MGEPFFEFSSVPTTTGPDNFAYPVVLSIFPVACIRASIGELVVSFTFSFPSFKTANISASVGPRECAHAVSSILLVCPVILSAVVILVDAFSMPLII